MALRTVDPVGLADQVWDEAASIAVLPDRDAEHLEPKEVERLVAAFDVARRRAGGRHAAPIGWLPASGRRVATALELAYDVAVDAAEIRGLREGMVDLQAFLPDREAEAVEAYARHPGRDRSADGAGAAGTDRVRWAQAIVISMLREDPKVVGAHAALRDVEIVIGQARRSLDAVHHYKEAQASGVVALWSWPIGLVVGLVLGSLLTSVSTTAILVVVAAAVAGWVLALAPAYGWAVGSLSSRVDRAATRAHDGRIVGLGRTVAAVMAVGLLFVGPVLIGLLLTLACHWYRIS